MWRVRRIQSECVEGFGARGSLGPAVAVCGGARIGPDDPTWAHHRNEHVPVEQVERVAERMRTWLTTSGEDRG